MTFISPWFLLGLLGIAIPVYLHLYYRKTPVQKEFPSLRLIKLSVEFVARRKKIRNLILMTLRILTVVLVVMAMARPFLGSSASAAADAQAPSAFVVLLDNSMSMSSVDKGISAFNSARSKALELIDQMTENDRATVGFVNEPGRLGYSQLTWDKEALKKIISDSKISAGGTDLASSLLPALKLLSPLKTHKKAVFLITDMTESSWRPFLERYDIAETDKSIDLIVVPMGAQAVDNTAVTDLRVESPIVMTGKKTVVKAQIANYSKQAKKIRAVFAINGERKSEREVEVEANSEKETDFEVVFAQSGMNRIALTINSDALPADNERHAALRVFDPCKILIVKPENLPGAPENKEDLFVKFALNPLAKSKDNSFITESRSANELNNVDFKRYAALILINQRHLSEDVVKQLSEYLMGGGNLITFLGDRTEPEWYNENLTDNLGSSYLLPARLFKRVGNAVSKSVYYRLTDLDLGHPAFNIFEKEENGDPSRARIYEFFQVKPNASAIVLCRMSHGFPGIVEEKRGAGKSLLVTFSADTKWTNWPVRPTWLPFLHQTLISMITSKEATVKNVKSGMPVSITLMQKDAGKLKIVLPDETEISPSSNNGHKGVLHLTVTNTEQSGYYEIVSDRLGVLTAFAVNPPAAESRLEKINLREIPRFIPLKDEPGKRTVKDKVSVLRNGYDLSGISLIMLVLLAIAENFLANKPAKKRTE